MSNKKITPQQMRKNLTYVQEGAPDFMRMLTGQSSSSSAANDPRNPYRKPIGIEAKFQPENPSDDDDETAHDILNDREEERPTVVVLKGGKHLDERQAKNILNNLPAGLSEAEIEKRLASGAGLDTDTNNDNEEASEFSEEEDQDPVDTNGKILFRRPKGSKPKKSNPVNSSASKKDFESTVLAEAEAKVQALKNKKKKTVASTTTSTTTSSSSTTNGSKRKANDRNNSEAPKKKKQQQQKKTTTSLLSFDDEE
ncbi:hypothetical protein BGX29_001131 [Mortierella sp. GBA35]|nr:hypothetical protein BGX29_001131 [Mortierella sp. GBA35]